MSSQIICVIISKDSIPTTVLVSSCIPGSPSTSLETPEGSTGIAHARGGGRGCSQPTSTMQWPPNTKCSPCLEQGPYLNLTGGISGAVLPGRGCPGGGLSSGPR